MIDLGGDIFEGGMAYVALSRARKLINVHLIDFLPERLYCNFSAIHEYNRLYDSANQSHKKIDIFNIIPINSSNKRKLEHELISFTEFQSEKLSKKAKIISNNSQLVNKNNAKKSISKESKKNSPLDIPFDNKRYFLKLNNNSNACFANSTIQAFLALGDTFFQKV